jgi:O-antigen/teichoic acid export membrane protein
MSLQQKAIKGVAWSAIQSWGSQVINFVVFALLSRLLDPQAFGLVAMASVFLVFVQIFVDQGFSNALVQRKEVSPSHLDTAFWTNIGLGLLMTVIGIGTAPLVANFFKQAQLVSILSWLSLSFTINALSSVQDAIFRRNLNFKPLAVRTLIATIAGGCTGTTMAFAGFGVWSLVGQQLVTGSVQAIILWLSSDWRPRLRFSRDCFGELFLFGINIVGINILNFINRQSDDLLIGYYLGATALGYYTIAYRIYLIMTQLLIGIVSQVAMPIFSRLQHELEKLRNAFYTFTELTSFAAFPIFIGVAVLAPELVKFLFGEKWLPSVPVMQILAFIGIQHVISYFYATVLMAMGKPSWQLKMNLFDATANFIGFYLVVRWGIVAVAAAYVIRGFLTIPINYWLAHRAIDLNLATYLQKLTAPVVGSLVMAICVWQTANFFVNITSLPILLAICILLGFGVYTLISLIIAPKIFQQLRDLSRLAVEA